MSTITAPGTMTMNGKRYVIIPEEEYIAALDAANTISPEEMTEEDWADVAESERRKSETGIPYEEARKMLGLE